MALLAEMFHSANTTKGTKPLNIPRPYDKPARDSGPRKQSTKDEIKRVMGGSIRVVK